jgi:SAM-dependent methyltransferase
MPENYELSGFTSIDELDDRDLYMRVLEDADAVEQLQDLKDVARTLVRPSHHVLDIGCGIGLETLRLAKLVGPAGRATGLDNSAAFIDEARRRVTVAGLDIDFITGNACELPFEDSSFDCARAERVLVYLDDPRRAIVEMRRVVRSGGSIAVIEPEFDSTTINLKDRSLVRKVMAHEADTAVAHNWLPGQLPQIFVDLGLSDVSLVTGVVVYPQDLAHLYFGSAARKANDAGILSDAEHTAWVSEFDALAAQGRLFGTVGYFLFTATIL